MHSINTKPDTLQTKASTFISKEKWEEIDSLPLEQKCFWCYNLINDLKAKLELVEALE